MVGGAAVAERIDFIADEDDPIGCGWCFGMPNRPGGNFEVHRRHRPLLADITSRPQYFCDLRRALVDFNLADF